MHLARMRRAEKPDAEFSIHQQHILHGVTFFLAAIMAFLLIRIFGALDASFSSIMAKRGGCSWLCASGSTCSVGIPLCANRCCKCSIERAGASPRLLSVVKFGRAS